MALELTPGSKDSDLIDLQCDEYFRLETVLLSIGAIAGHVGLGGDLDSARIENVPVKRGARNLSRDAAEVQSAYILDAATYRLYERLLLQYIVEGNLVAEWARV